MFPDEESDDAGSQFEPDEYDPEADLADPERELPTIPEAPSPGPDGDADVPAELQRTFWTVVLLVNVALAAASLGVMFVVFRGQWVYGGVGAIVGTVAGLRAYLRYREWRDRDDPADEPDGGGSSPEDGPDEDGDRTRNA